ncbi:hypothetical protein LTR84_008087 [Exophiala bonariae]|uniref:Uncharacterized protein n=1 Tax=Exophiala bonariae TaxID=1690606 RepID=A0AAV9NMY8_9EURO|nr:hypothetical protein LTR84_008087 [Exophiala bonariae]
MLLRGVSRVSALVGLVVFGLVISTGFYDQLFLALSLRGAQWAQCLSKLSSTGTKTMVAQSHTEVFSRTTRTSQYFPIEFGEEEAMNPSIIPHPSLADTWIITAQRRPTSGRPSIWFSELVCEAKLKDGKLSCIKAPSILPIAATIGDNCVGDLDFFGLNIGPHDARVFYGPQNPYAIYGSNSGYTCFGQWIQDFRVLVDWEMELHIKSNFRLGTELTRPPPFSAVEKNWFLFWDKDGDTYVHYDIFPQRSFAKLNSDGSVGLDLAPLAAGAGDHSCMTRMMPELAPSLESIHQATNSLSITLCDRSDDSCQPNDSNTYIMTIFQHKSFYYYHSVYEPYVMLFKRNSPFEIQGISSKPIWIRGRAGAGEAKRPPGAEYEKLDSWNQTEMIYVTSMSWKEQGQKYHGYLDDVLFLAFGIEDERTGGIDILAGDLVRDIETCSTS